MITCIDHGAFYHDGQLVIDDDGPEKLAGAGISARPEEGAQRTIAYSVLKGHNTSGSMDDLRLKADAIASHDITYVGIIQTARASGLTEFPLPYVLTNCHNSLCAVGGTINEDDHLFGLSAARRYGGIFVPAHMAVIHAFMRERFAGCGKMIIGSDSHTRYGALGTMAFGEGGGELVKQLLGDTYDIKRPGVIAVWLEGEPRPGIGPHDVALALVGAVFSSGFVKNKVLEFMGPGIARLNQEFRNGIDVMTTETTCLSSIWCTDDETRSYLTMHGRADEYRPLAPGQDAYYDGVVKIDLSKVESMISMPFHPSNAYTIHELNENLDDVIALTEKRAADQLGVELGALGLADRVHDGGLYATQGFIGGCAGGTYDSVVDAADILRDGAGIGDGPFSLSVYPASQPAWIELAKNGTLASLAENGAVIRTAFCGPCFGAGDVPANKGFSLRHATRNFPNREGARPGEGQVACVALMDARSIAASAANGGRITAATDLEPSFTKPPYHFDDEPYRTRVYNGYGRPEPDCELVIGPNITDWPKMQQLPENLLLRVASLIEDDVTTTDELIPSGETSSYRSNPLRLAEFTLSRRDPEYVSRTKVIQQAEAQRAELIAEGDIADGQRQLGSAHPWLGRAITALCESDPALEDSMSFTRYAIGSVVYARKPGDGSAREQAASCQKVLGGWANIAREYATKRYRSNLINWGMVPFTLDGNPPFALNDVIAIPGIRRALQEGAPTIQAYAVQFNDHQGRARQTPMVRRFELTMPELTDEERQIILDGCLINHNRARAQRAEQIK